MIGIAKGKIIRKRFVKAAAVSHDYEWTSTRSIHRILMYFSSLFDGWSNFVSDFVVSEVSIL